MRRLLIANRGEIAVRIARTAREMGLVPIAVYSEADADALHVRECAEAVAVGPPEPAASYLDIGRILDAARATGADAVHPGYGFLSENPTFARAIIDAGLRWVGPPPHAMEALGDKLAARRLAVDHGVPVLPGSEGGDPSELKALGFPLLLKAAGGGGGRGMRRVGAEGELEAALVAAAAEAEAAFGDRRVYAERLLSGARHVEVQVLADAHGGVIALGERDCSTQRRHQKLVEESPSPALDEAGRQRLTDAAVRLVRAVGYLGAGTVEFLVDAEGSPAFLEVNTRLQVEHPVTEARCGLDLVREQLRVAMGERLAEAPTLRGHAMECRILAEDPARGFLPSPGRITRLRWPGGPGVRVDAGVVEGEVVSPHYDPLLAKLIVHADSREAARRRMIRALEELVLLGVAHTGEVLLQLLAHHAFVEGRVTTDFFPREFGAWTPPEVDAAAWVAAWLAAERPPVAAEPRAGRLPTPFESLRRGS